MTCDPLVRVVPPMLVTDAKLTAINVTEDDHAEFILNTAYPVGTLVIVTDTGIHKIYKSAAADSGDFYPPDFPLKWTFINSTNRWAMFDGEVSTQTINDNGITFTIVPAQRADAIVFENLSGTSIHVEVTDGSSTLFDETKELVGLSAITNMYLYLTAEFQQKKAVAFTNLPVSSSAEINVTIAGGDATACGIVILGKQIIIGELLLNRSFGVVRVPRQLLKLGPLVKRGDFTVKVENEDVDRVLKSVGPLLDEVCAYICADIHESELYVGKQESEFSISVQQTAFVEASLRIQGVI